MTRQEAQEKLKQLFGFDDFFDNQWHTIERLFKGERVLLIEKTGFGNNLFSFNCIDERSGK
jgi:ATP-dependent DNA helicase RecQ